LFAYHLAVLVSVLTVSGEAPVLELDTSTFSVRWLKADLHLTCPGRVWKRLTVHADLAREKGPVWTLHFGPGDRSAHEMSVLG
jgi:hypothetical protein